MIEFQSLANSIFAVSVPVLVALYMLKLNRKTVKVPNVAFLKMIVSENRGSSLFKRLTSNILLLLEVLFLAALVGALMNPGRAGLSVVGKRLVLIVDNTITMTTAEAGGETRFETAKKEALEVLAANPNSSVSIIELSNYPRLAANNETDFRAAAAKLSAVSQTHFRPDWRFAFSLAEGLASEGQNPEIHAFSDFSSFSVAGISTVPGKVRHFYHVTGAKTRNVGISEFDITADPETGSAAQEIFFTVKNYDDYEVSFPVSVTSGGAKLYSSVFTLSARGSESKVLKRFGGGGAVRIEIAFGDSMPQDNVRSGSAGEGDRLSVLVSSERPYFYDAALSAAGGLAVETVPPGVPRSIYRNREFDLVVTDDSAEIAESSKYRCANFVAICPPDGFMGIKYGEWDYDVTFRAPSFPYEYMRSMDLSDIYVYRARRALATGSFGEIAFGSGGVPLFMRLARFDSSVFAVMFDPRQSNFPLKTAFPIFFSNVAGAVRNLVSAPEIFNIGSDNRMRLRRIYPAIRGPKLVVRDDGSRDVAEIDVSSLKSTDLLRLPPLTATGRYRLFNASAGPSARPVAEFYLNAPVGAVLSIKPGRVPGPARTAPAASAPAFEASHVSFAPVLILAALLLLLLDWIYQNFKVFFRGGGDA